MPRTTSTSTATTTTKKKEAPKVEPKEEAPAEKRQLYKAKTSKEFNHIITDLAKEASTMVDHLYKQVSEENLPKDYKVPEKETFEKLIGEIKELKDPYKELTAKKKREPSPNNYGLKTPQYMSGDMCRFVNQHGGLPKDLQIEIDKKTDKGAFDRISLTKFWVRYIEKNSLKDQDKKSQIIPDENMKKLFNLKTPEGITYFQSMVKRITEIQQGQNYRSSNNSARFKKDSNGNVESLNYAGLQVLLRSFFETNYTIPNQENHIEKLRLTNEFFSDSKKKPAK